jgi:replicative DNA helicase
LDILPSERNAKTIGDLRDETDIAWKEYQTAKMNPGQAWGRFMGLQVVDEACHGCKKGELWIHAGSPGDGKTTLALNWAVNQVNHYKGNVLYVSLEMPFTQVRNIAYSIHSSSLIFQGRSPLEYRKIRDGQLSHEEEEFYQKVLTDFRTNPDYCQFQVWQPDRDVTINDIKLHAELLHKRMELSLIIIDHSQLVEPRRHFKDYTIGLNSVIREAKKLALHFNGGEGVAVCLLHQINRQGRAEAEKNDGVYKFSALSYANEAERSADYITATFLDDDRRSNGSILMTNLKNRDNKPFAPTSLSIDFSCRRIRNLDTSELNGMSVEENDSVLDAMGEI